MVGPHSDDLDDLVVIHNLVDQAMLYVYAPRICTRQVTYELLKWRRSFVWVLFEHAEQPFCLSSEPRLHNFLCVFLGLFCEN